MQVDMEKVVTDTDHIGGFVETPYYTSVGTAYCPVTINDICISDGNTVSFQVAKN